MTNAPNQVFSARCLPQNHRQESENETPPHFLDFFFTLWDNAHEQAR